MSRKKGQLQLILLFAGLLLFAATYLLYPNINKNEVSQEKVVNKDFEKGVSEEKISTFENLEYTGLYNFDQPFIEKAEQAHILNEEPDVVYMERMYVNLDLGDGREVVIISDKGTYNKKTFDCFFEQNVKATDGDTIFLSENFLFI